MRASNVMSPPDESLWAHGAKELFVTLIVVKIFRYKYSQPVYNGPVYYGHWTTSQNFQLHYIFCKGDLYIAVTLYITVTLPFPKGYRCTQV